MRVRVLFAEETDDEIFSNETTPEITNQQSFAALPPADCTPRVPLVFERVILDTPTEELPVKRSPPALVNMVVGL